MGKGGNDSSFGGVSPRPAAPIDIKDERTGCWRGATMLVNRRSGFRLGGRNDGRGRPSEGELIWPVCGGRVLASLELLTFGRCVLRRLTATLVIGSH